MQELRPLHCRLIHSRPAENGFDERVVLVAFGAALSIAALPDWSDPPEAMKGNPGAVDCKDYGDVKRRRCA